MGYFGTKKPKQVFPYFPGSEEASLKYSHLKL